MKLLGIEVTFEEFDKLMCEQSQGKQLVVENGKVIAIDRVQTEEEKILTYEQLVVFKIRERYTIDQELAILRQRDTKPEEFAEYNSYVEQCKVEAKEAVNGR